eukprot:400319-Amphidinium_carterae.1
MQHMPHKLVRYVTIACKKTCPTNQHWHFLALFRKEPEISVSGIVKHAYGAAALLKVTAAGDLYLMGKYRFAEARCIRVACAKVSHIKAVSITPTSFVIAFSGLFAAAASELGLKVACLV